MIDWKRMEWQHRANRIATWVRLIAIFLVIDEAILAIRYHWPLWDDIAMPVTFAIHQVAGFIQQRTALYRIDI